MPWVNKQREKEYKKQYYLKNRESGCHSYQARKHSLKKYAKNNRLKLLKKRRDNYNPEKAKLVRERYKDTINSNYRESVKSLSEKYLIKLLISQGWTRDELERNTEILEAKKMIVKLKREIKKQTHGTTQRP